MAFHERMSPQDFEKCVLSLPSNGLNRTRNKNSRIPVENEKIKVTFVIIELAFKSTSKIVGRINP